MKEKQQKFSEPKEDIKKIAFVTALICIVVLSEISSGNLLFAKVLVLSIGLFQVSHFIFVNRLD
jgi:hypothetical protein